MFAFVARNPDPIKVLLVEDSEGDAILIRESLQESPAEFQITHAERLAPALDHLTRAEFDVVVLDLNLPDSKGLDTLLKTRAAAPDVAVVVLTGVNDENLALKAVECGAQDYLVKDLLEGDLLAHSLCHAVERQQLHARLKQAQQREIENQKLESLEMLAGGMAQDFNNLLTVILGKVEMAHRKATASPAVKEALEQIKNAGTRAGELCKQLFAYSGKGRCVPLLYNLGAVIEDLAPLLQRLLPPHVTLKYQLARPLPPIKADLAQLRQLVTNLVRNAVEAMDGRPGAITLGAERIHADREYLAKTLLGDGLPEGDYVRLGIADTGCGMDPSTRAKIFEPFFSTRANGQGIGLPAVQGILRSCKGTLEVISEKGRGTTFNILFPCSVLNVAPRSEEQPPADEWRGRGTVLVLDDDPRIQELLGEMLKEMGFEAVIASHEVRGVEHERERLAAADLILLDVAAPADDGESPLTTILRIKPDARVIGISPYTREECAAFLDEKKMAGFVQKPFRFADLQNQIQAALQGK